MKSTNPRRTTLRVGLGGIRKSKEGNVRFTLIIGTMQRLLMNENDNCFDLFWALWPSSHRKASKSKCLERWKKKALDKQWKQIHAHLTWMKTTDMWKKSNGDFIPAPLVYINQERWDGAEIPSPVTINIHYRDPVLDKLENDTKNAAPMPEDVKKRMMELRRALKSI